MVENSTGARDALTELARLGVVQRHEMGGADDPVFRERYAAAAARREARILGALADAGVDALELSTSDDLLEALLRFAALRKRRGLSTVGLARHLEAGIP